MKLLGVEKLTIDGVNKIKQSLGIPADKKVPEELRDEYLELVGKETDININEAITEKTIGTFARKVIPLGAVDPKIVDREDIDPETEVSLNLIMEHTELAVTLTNEILMLSKGE